LAGADENRGQNDPDQDAGTVPRSHHLQLYSEARSGDIPARWPKRGILCLRPPFRPCAARRSSRC
jgi:hypothetical protein